MTYPAQWVDHLCDVIEHPRFEESWGTREGALKWAVRQIEKDITHLETPLDKKDALAAVMACAWAEGVTSTGLNVRSLLKPGNHRHPKAGKA